MSSTVSEQPLLLAGRLVAAEQHEEVINPATGQAIAQCPVATPAMVDEAVRAAAAALPAWGEDAALRSRVLEAMADLLHDHGEELADLLSAEIGIPLRDAKGEVAAGTAFLRHRASAGLPVDVLHDDERQTVTVVRSPVGVVAAIVPWNAPLLIACEKIGSAFAAGDTVVLKPSPLAPLTLVRFAALIADTPPAGVLSVLPGSDEVGVALTTHPNVAMISFTGSTATGRAIMAAVSPTLKRLSLELGGNDAAIVLPGVDAEKVAPKVLMAAFYRTGQICAAVKRVLVHEDDAEAFVAALATAAEGLVAGDPFGSGVAIGPLSNSAQRDRVAQLVDAAVADGATAVTGGAVPDRDGFFYPPTIVTGAGPDAALVAEEQFGPALPVLTYSTIDDAIEQANATEYGLGASVWGTDLDEATRVAGRMDAGSVWVNRHGLLAPDVPFGGFKQSGIGRSNGAVGIDAYCELKTVSVAKPRKPQSA